MTTVDLKTLHSFTYERPQIEKGYANQTLHVDVVRLGTEGSGEGRLPAGVAANGR